MAYVSLGIRSVIVWGFARLGIFRGLGVQGLRFQGKSLGFRV